MIAFRKNTFNGTCTDCSSTALSSSGFSYELYNVATQEVKFTLNPSEYFVTNWFVRDVFAAPSDIRLLPGIKITKIGKLVTLLIPSFYGNLQIGNNQSVMTIITPGDIPSRFLPTHDVSMPVNALNTGVLISQGQDFADLIVESSGYVNLVSRTYLWNGSCGIRYDISISWIVE